MTEKAESGGVNVRYFVSEDLATGTCAVLVTNQGKCRSLVANLSAANTYSVEHLRANEQWNLVEKARMVYITGFFLTVSPESIQLMGKHCADTKKLFLMNLSAPFLCEVPIFFERMQAALPFVDILFGNEIEARTFARVMNWDTDNSSTIAARIAQLPGKVTARPRVVVITQGPEATVLAIGDHERIWVEETYPVIPIDSKDIVDTNGAGDAFVGGFLAGLARGDSLSKCVALGNHAANVIIQRSGVTLPIQDE